MGRPAKNKPVVEEEVIAPVAVVEEVEETPEVVEATVVKATSSTRVTIKASFKTRTKEGDRIIHKYEGRGADVLEALDTVVGSEEELVDEFEKPFPLRINLLVNVTVKRGDYSYDRAIAPHDSEAIFTLKDVELVNRLFGL